MLAIYADKLLFERFIISIFLNFDEPTKATPADVILFSSKISFKFT